MANSGAAVTLAVDNDAAPAEVEASADAAPAARSSQPPASGLVLTAPTLTGVAEGAGDSRDHGARGGARRWFSRGAWIQTGSPGDHHIEPQRGFGPRYS